MNLKIIKKISCGDGFTVCIDNEGIVYSWGKNNKGQLGFDIKYENATIVSGTKCQSTPKIIESLVERKIFAVDISCGGDFSFMIDKDNKIYSWGYNEHSQLARSTLRLVESSPEIAGNLIAFNVNSIKTGWMHGVLLDDQGDIYIWGNPYYDYDKNILDITKPTRINLPERINKISSGFHHLAVVDSKFEIYTVGVNNYGQCGVKVENKFIFNPNKLNTNDKISDVYCGAFHTIYQTLEEKLFVFGHNL